MDADQWEGYAGSLAGLTGAAVELILDVRESVKMERIVNSLRQVATQIGEYLEYNRYR